MRGYLWWSTPNGGSWRASQTARFYSLKVSSWWFCAFFINFVCIFHGNRSYSLKFLFIYFFKLSFSYTFAPSTEKMKGFIDGSWSASFSWGTAGESISYVSPPSPTSSGRSNIIARTAELGDHPAQPFPAVILSKWGFSSGYGVSAASEAWGSSDQIPPRGFPASGALRWAFPWKPQPHHR